MSDISRPPGGDRHDSTWRLTLGVMFLAQFMSGVGFSFVLPFFPFYFRDLGVVTQEENLMWNSWASLVFGVTMTISAPLWGILADRHGRKLMVMRSMFAGAIILGLMGRATSPWHLVILRMFQGATTGTVSASVTLVSSITPSVNLGFSLGLLQTAMLLGAAAGPIMGGFLAEHFGFRLSCYISSALLLSGALLVIFGAVEKFEPPQGGKTDGGTIIKGIIGTSGFKIILSIYFLIYVMTQMLAPILPLYIETFTSATKRPESLTGIFVGITQLIAGLSAIFYGRLGDRFGYSKILVISLVATGLATIPQAFASSITILFIERCLTGLAIGGLIPSVNALVSRIIPRDKIGSAYGLTSAVTCLGIGMGPFIGGIMASFAGLRFPFAFMGFSAFVIAYVTQRSIKRSGFDNGSS